MDNRDDYSLLYRNNGSLGPSTYILPSFFLETKDGRVQNILSIYSTFLFWNGNQFVDHFLTMLEWKMLKIGDGKDFGSIYLFILLEWKKYHSVLILHWMYFEKMIDSCSYTLIYYISQRLKHQNKRRSFFGKPANMKHEPIDIHHLWAFTTPLHHFYHGTSLLWLSENPEASGPVL